MALHFVSGLWVSVDLANTLQIKTMMYLLSKSKLLGAPEVSTWEPPKNSTGEKAWPSTTLFPYGASDWKGPHHRVQAAMP